jgi:CheY-like chemotaxis protein
MSTATAPAATNPARPAPPAASAVELAAVMDRATGPRLAAAERLVRQLPALLGDGLDGVELYLSPAGTFTAVARVVGEASPMALRRRLAFWCARAGARTVALGDLAARERTQWNANLSRADRRATMGADTVAEEAAAFFAAAGAPPAAKGRPQPRPVLELEVGGPGWTATRWDAEGRTLFVPSPLAPPEGDELVLRLMVPGAEAHCAAGRVSAVRDDAKPGSPTGFSLALGEATPELLRALSAHVPAQQGIEAKLRAAPRYPVRAPAAVVPEGPGAEEEEEAEGDELCGSEGPHGFVMEDISQGGAFLRTAERLQAGARVRVVAALPTGELLHAVAQVVAVETNGVGVKWLGGQEELVAGAVARVAAMKPRALLVDDDALSRQMLGDALAQRGFEVLTAGDGATGLSVLADEILTLDLLVADLFMPNMDGEALLRIVRHEGGERDLAIVVVSGRVEPGLEAKLERQGADAVLSKSLGPQVVAQAAVAVMERKRGKHGA